MAKTLLVSNAPPVKKEKTHRLWDSNIIIIAAWFEL